MYVFKLNSFDRVTTYGIYSSSHDALEREMGAIHQDGTIALDQDCPKQIGP